MEAETEVKCLQAEEHSGLPGATRAGREGFVSRAFTAQPYQHRDLKISSLPNCDKTNFCCSKPPSLWHFYGQP